jgi:hypothetical protein
MNILAKHKSIFKNHYYNDKYIDLKKYYLYFYNGELIVYNFIYADTTDIVNYYITQHKVGVGNDYSICHICKHETIVEDILHEPIICYHCKEYILGDTLIKTHYSINKIEKIHISLVENKPIITYVFIDKYHHYVCDEVEYEIKITSLKNLCHQSKIRHSNIKRILKYISKHIFPKYHVISQMDNFTIDDIKNRIIREFLAVSGVDTLI